MLICKNCKQTCVGEFNVKRNKKWNLLDNNVNVKKAWKYGMFIHEVNVKQRIPNLNMFIQACLIDQKIRYVHPIML